MMTFTQFMSASPVTLQRQEHAMFMAALDEEIDQPSPCDCGVLAQCYKHAQQAATNQLYRR